MKKISVVIPTYNREKTILRALHSVLDQSYGIYEVIVVDDASTDGTDKLVESIKDERIKYIKLEKNGGPSNARNRGAQLATGEWIAFQDSDDCWYRDKLEKQVEHLNNHPEYTMIYCMYQLYIDDAEGILIPQKPYSEIMEGDMLNTLLVKNVIGTPTILVNRERFMNAGGFSTDYKALEDWEFVVRFSKENLIGFVPEPLMNAYLLEGGVSSNQGAYFESRCRMLATYRKDMEKAGIFDVVMREIFVRAEHYNAVEGVKKIMMYYLTR